MKKFINVIAFLLSIIAIVLISIYFYVKSTNTVYDFKLSSSELDSEVEVIFDNIGVPHIYAKSEKDAMFALGYVHASERLWQMDLLRHVGGGNLSELFGEDLIENDKFLRTLGINKTAIISAESFVKHAPKHVIEATDAYLKGINQFIKNDKFPVEYAILGIDPAEFTKEDIFRTTGYMAYSFAIGLKTDPIVSWIKENLDEKYLEDLEINLHKNNTTIKSYGDLGVLSNTVASLDHSMPFPQFLGSNSWVIGAEKTKSGKVLFANDAHIAFASPSVWYEAHITTPDLEYYGNHLAGFPFPLIGHTKNHSWGITMFENDDIDLYKETIKDDKYLYDGVYYNLDIREEEIKVKGGESVFFEVKESKHGPLINHLIDDATKSDALAMWWIYNEYEDNKLIESAYNFSRSSGLNSFKKTLANIHAPGLNIMYGDSDNNIAYWACAKLPVRAPHIDSKEIIDGSKPENEIKGWYDFKLNPQSVNPPTNYVYSANNAPSLINDSIYHPGYYYHGNSRAKSIMKAIENKENNWTVEDMKELQLQNSSDVYLENTRLILAKIKTDELSEEEKKVFDVLKKWEGNHELNAAGASIYYTLMYESVKAIMEDELGQSNFKAFMATLVWENSLPGILKNSSSPWYDNVATEQIEDIETTLTSAFKTSCKLLTEKYGNNIENWAWEYVHELTFEHPLGKVKPLNRFFNVGPFKVNSGKDALNKMGFKMTDKSFYPITSGPSMRIVLDFADVENSESIIPTGQSGNPISPFYSDQSKKYINGKYRKQLMNRKEIEHSEYKSANLTPEK